MRLSRKAGVLSCGVIWVKYYCSQRISTITQNFLGVQETVSSGNASDKYFQGLTGYTFDSEAGTVYASGDQGFVNTSNPGVVYENNGTDRKSIYGYQVLSHGYWQIFTRTVRSETTTKTTYDISGRVGSVIAAKGEYPDAKNGYTYVTTEGAYTIMMDGDGNYFAYV